MGEVHSYPNGTFCWVDLGTTDVAGAQTFYGELFGWEFREMPAGDAAYVLCRMGGRDVAGIHEHSEEEGTGWSSYVSVADVRQTTARSKQLGATVVTGATEVPGTARMSVIRDPAGAEVALWEALGFPGAGLVNEIGTWTWNELTTPDVDGARAFYGDLFGWEADAEAEAAPITRFSFVLGELLVGGVHAPVGGEDPTPRWTISLVVADADRAAAEVVRLHGEVLIPPTDVPSHEAPGLPQRERLAVVRDPAGGTFSVTAVPGRAFRGVDGS